MPNESYENGGVCPKVSVIVPVYNVEKHLDFCLGSIIAQTLSDIEIICVNDGSTDSSPDILQHYAKLDNRIKIINQQNAGLSVARNTGMKVARGEFLGFVDSDDYISLKFFELLYNAAKQNDSEIASARKIIFYYADGDSRNEVTFFGKPEGVYFIGDNPVLPDDFPRMTWNKIYNREFIERVGLTFLPGAIREDEYWHWCLMPYVSNIVVVEGDCFYFYRRHEGTITDKIGKGQMPEPHLFNVFDGVCRYYRENNLFDRYSLPFFLLEEEITIQNAFGRTNTHTQAQDIILKYKDDIKVLKDSDKAFLSSLNLL